MSFVQPGVRFPPNSAATHCGHYRLFDAAAKPAPRMKLLFVSDGGARRTSKRNHFALGKAALRRPIGELRAREVERIAELDEHVEGHKQAERILSSVVVDDVFNGDERAASRKRCSVSE